MGKNIEKLALFCLEKIKKTSFHFYSNNELRIFRLGKLFNSSVCHHVLKNILIDKNVAWLANDENRESLKDFDKVHVVGEDLKQGSFDENCAAFCIDRNCDFLTADKKAYTNFFKNKKIKSVEISRFIRDKNSEEYVLLVQIKV